MKQFIAETIIEFIEKMIVPALKRCGYHMEYDITPDDTTQGSALFV